MECLWVLLCSAGFEIFSLVVTVMGGNYYALLRTVPPNPPGGSFLELPAAVGNVAAVAMGTVGAARLHRERVLLCSAGFEIFSLVVMVLGRNYYALLCTVPPQPPRGFLLRMVCCCGECRCCGSRFGGSCGGAQRVGVALYGEF